MKPGWTYKKLPEISENLDSIRKPVTKKNRTAGIYPYYGASGIVDYVDDYLFDEDLLCISEDGANLLMRTYPIAFPISGKVWVNNHAHVLRFESLTTQRYVEYFFTGLKLDDYITGAAQPKLTQKALNSIVIKIPTTISEQHRIVERLDAAFTQIDELKANAEKQVNEARALFQRALTEAMEPKEGWEEKALKDVSTIVGDYGLSVSSKPFDGVRYLRITDITDWGDLNDDIVSANVDSDKKQQELEEGDILFARTGATVGKTLVYKKEFGECLFAGYLIRYRLDKNKISPRFMYYVTHSKKYYDWVFVNQEAAAQPNISAKKYNLLPVNYPPLSEQQHIVVRLDALSARVRELEEIQKNVITECDNMKQAILRQVFE